MNKKSNKVFIFCLLLLFLASCITSQPLLLEKTKKSKDKPPQATQRAKPSYPVWYDKSKALQQGNRNILVGFGYATGENREKNARGQALANIQSQIRTKIFSTNECNTQVVVREKKEAVTEYCEKKLKQVSEGVLSGVKTEKTELKEDFYFIALTYNDSPAHQKIATKLKEMGFTCPANTSVSAPSAQTIFGKELQEVVGCEVNWTLSYNSNHQFWQIILNQQNISTNLFPQFSFMEIENFLPSSSPEQISFSFTKKTFKEKEPYYIKIKINKDGYLSLFSIDEQASTLVMLENNKIASHQNFQFPDNTKFDGLVSEIIEPEKNTINEYYLASVCDNPLDLNFFHKLANSITETTKYNYGKLLDKIKADKNNCATFSSFVSISKKKE